MGQFEGYFTQRRRAGKDENFFAPLRLCVFAETFSN